jgi:hypothetical protein
VRALSFSTFQGHCHPYSIQSTTARFLSTSSNCHQQEQEQEQYDENYFLNQVDSTISNVLQEYSHIKAVLEIPDGKQREAHQVSKRMHKRLQLLRKNSDCPRCWMQHNVGIVYVSYVCLVYVCKLFHDGRIRSCVFFSCLFAHCPYLSMSLTP